MGKGNSVISRSKKSLNSKKDEEDNVIDSDNIDSGHIIQNNPRPSKTYPSVKMPPLPYSKSKIEEEPNEELFESTSNLLIK